MVETCLAAWSELMRKLRYFLTWLLASPGSTSSDDRRDDGELLGLGVYWLILLVCQLSVVRSSPESGPQSTVTVWEYPGCLVGRTRSGGPTASEAAPGQGGRRVPGGVLGVSAVRPGAPDEPASATRRSALSFKHKYFRPLVASGLVGRGCQV